MGSFKSDDEAVALVLINKHKEALSEYDQIWNDLLGCFERSRINFIALRDLGAAGRVFDLDLEVPENNARVSAQNFYLSPKARALRSKVKETVIVDYSDLAAKQGRMTSPPPAVASEQAMPRIRDVILERLKSAGSGGTRAAPIRQYIKEKYGRDIHEKTVGMTLYRLASDKLVHRIGITWFFGPEGPGMQDPGAPTPGSQEDLLK